MTDTNTETEESTSRPSFAAWLTEHRGGLLDGDLAEALAKVVDAVVRTEKKGTVTLKLTVSKEGDMVAILDEVNDKAPEKLEARLYFVGLDGQLTRNNPMQPSLLED